MTNSEAIKLLSQEKIPMTLDGKLNEPLVIAHIKAISALEENDKLKAEIEQLKEDYSVLARQYNNVENSSIIYYNEVKQLKSELEQSVKLPCKVGDKLFSTENGYIEEFKVRSINHIVNLVEFRRFDETVFFTRKEAERSLKGQV